MTDPHVATVRLMAVTGGPRVWVSLPTNGYYDPRRFPEELVLTGDSGTDSEVLRTIPRPNGALVVRIEFAGAQVVQRFQLAISIGDAPILAFESLPYRHAGRLHAASHVRHRLDSVEPIARVCGYKYTPRKWRLDEQVFEARPTIPHSAEWL
jgi:hypothetical protein